MPSGKGDNPAVGKSLRWPHRENDAGEPWGPAILVPCLVEEPAMNSRDGGFLLLASWGCMSRGMWSVL